mgnify:CR=1 FL=1
MNVIMQTTHPLLLVNAVSEYCYLLLGFTTRLCFVLYVQVRVKKVVPVYLDATAQTIPGLACRWKNQPQMYIQLLDMWMSSDTS